MSTLTCQDTIRAGLYARVSTTDQSLIRQHEANLAACERYHWTPVEYDDPGLSASRFAKRGGGDDRKEWRRLIADLAAGKLDVLVLWEPSRGDRQLTGWSTVLDTCRKHGVKIHITCQDHTYDLSRGREWRNLAEDGIDSAWESEKLSMRIASGKAEARRAGRPQGTTPYGIHRVNDPDRIRHKFIRNEPHPVTGAIAARVVREVAAGHGYVQIRDGLNNDGVPAPKGGPWHASTVKAIASKSVYAEVGLVTEEESLRARARLAEGKRKRERPTNQRFRYSSVIACGTCGQMLRAGRREGINRYTCPGGHISIPADQVEVYVDARCIERLSRPDVISRVRKTHSAAAAEARAEAARYRQKIADATESYNNDRLTLESLEAITKTNKAKAEAAEKRARDAEMPSALAGLPDENHAIVAERWESLTMAARKAAFRVLYPDATAVPSGRGRSAPIDQRVVLLPNAG